MVKPKICNTDKKQPALPEFCDFGEWAVPIKDLSKIKEFNRDHVYILPDQSVWMLNYEGTGLMQLNSGGNGIGNGQPTLLKNNDGLIKISGSGTTNLEVDLEIDQLLKKLDITELQETIKNHINNETIHVTEADKKAWVVV